MNRYVAAKRMFALIIGWVIMTLALPLVANDSTNAVEAAWKELVTAEESVSGMKPPSLESVEFERFLKVYCQKAGEIGDRFNAYQKTYQDSPHREEAWEKWMDLLNIAAYKLPARRAELEKAEQPYLDKPKLDHDRHETILNNQIDRASDIKERERLVRRINQERRVNQESQSSDGFFCWRMLNEAEFSDAPHSIELNEAVLKMSAGKPGLKHFHDQALALKKKLDRIDHPLSLKFTALDGKEINLEQYRGKVVLLDFWATWCPPCVAGMPAVKSAWTALHDQGFEVIGVSYDTEREALEKFVKQNKIPWPQFFDTKGKESSLNQSMGAPGPPNYWLIDRQGLLVDVNAHENLEEKVKRLLVRTDISKTPVVSGK
ncbi:MAG: resA 1 [Verrucomicrobiales bacterium]|nr:resA 1 [Verrucomicrobiales bacterium]